MVIVSWKGGVAEARSGKRLKLPDTKAKHTLIAYLLPAEQLPPEAIDPSSGPPCKFICAPPHVFHDVCSTYPSGHGKGVLAIELMEHIWNELEKLVDADKRVIFICNKGIERSGFAAVLFAYIWLVKKGELVKSGADPPVNNRDFIRLLDAAKPVHHLTGRSGYGVALIKEALFNELKLIHQEAAAIVTLDSRTLMSAEAPYTYMACPPGSSRTISGGKKREVDVDTTAASKRPASSGTEAAILAADMEAVVKNAFTWPAAELMSFGTHGRGPPLTVSGLPRTSADIDWGGAIKAAPPP